MGAAPGDLIDWHPDRLFLDRRPHARLVVEVDRVEGIDLPRRALADLHTFLSQHCDKPGGVVIRADDPIPRDEARDMSEQALALRYLGGPGEADAAFLYLLLYDGRLAGSRGGASPYVRPLPYPAAIMVEGAWLRGRAAGAGDTLAHEAGHVLGLTRDRDHGDGVHCDDRVCLMHTYREVNPLESLFPTGTAQPVRGICGRCQTNLFEARRSDEDSQALFWGPFLVREEAAYRVLSLPGIAILHVGSLESGPWTDLLEQIRDSGPEAGKVSYTWATTLNRAAPEGRAALQAAADAAADDPYPPVREAAAEMARDLADN